VPEKKEKIVIDLDQLRARAAALEQLIQGYQEVLQRLEEARVNIQAAIETIEALGEAGEEVLVPADKISIAYFFAKPSNTDKILVHLGADVYAALNREKAVERLTKRLAEVESDIQRISEQLSQALNEYNAIVSILSQATAAIAQGRQPRS